MISPELFVQIHVIYRWVAKALIVAAFLVTISAVIKKIGQPREPMTAETAARCVFIALWFIVVVLSL